MSGFRSRALKLTESTRLDVLIDNKMLLKKRRFKSLESKQLNYEVLSCLLELSG
jgi:hypothetical protein